MNPRSTTMWMAVCLLLPACLILSGCAVSPSDQTGYVPTTPGHVSPNGPSRGEELWVIEKKPQAAQPAGDARQPGTGALMAKLPSRPTEVIPVPLKHTDVQATITGYIATVDVTQQFQNPYAEKIEAVYVFPLPPNASVNEFIMTIGERKIRGIIRDRDEAQRIYAEAKRQGYVASLLTQARPNLFTQSVANIEPGKRVDVNIKYFHTLTCVDGWYEYVFPMVAGPRFNPPTERSGRDISLAVHLNPGVPIEQIECKTHPIAVDRDAAPAQLEVKLGDADSIPNRDFVLRYKVDAKAMNSAVMVQLARQIKQVATESGLMSSLTAFIAVDSMTKTTGDPGASVPVPEGVSHKTNATPKSE